MTSRRTRALEADSSGAPRIRSSTHSRGGGAHRGAVVLRDRAGATVLFRANYLAAPKFSGGGHAGFSIDLGLGLDVRLAGRLHGTAAYPFQRIKSPDESRRDGEIDAPIQETLARLGLAVGF